MDFLGHSSSKDGSESNDLEDAKKRATKLREERNAQEIKVLETAVNEAIPPLQIPPGALKYYEDEEVEEIDQRILSIKPPPKRKPPPPTSSKGTNGTQNKDDAPYVSANTRYRQKRAAAALKLRGDNKSRKVPRYNTRKSALAVRRKPPPTLCAETKKQDIVAPAKENKVTPDDAKRDNNKTNNTITNDMRLAREQLRRSCEGVGLNAEAENVIKPIDVLAPTDASFLDDSSISSEDSCAKSVIPLPPPSSSGERYYIMGVDGVLKPINKPFWVDSNRSSPATHSSRSTATSKQSVTCGNTPLPGYDPLQVLKVHDEICIGCDEDECPNKNKMRRAVNDAKKYINEHRHDGEKDMRHNAKRRTYFYNMCKMQFPVESIKDLPACATILAYKWFPSKSFFKVLTKTDSDRERLLEKIENDKQMFSRRQRRTTKWWKANSDGTCINERVERELTVGSNVTNSNDIGQQKSASPHPTEKSSD